jgi:hypothetical protein
MELRFTYEKPLSLGGSVHVKSMSYRRKTAEARRFFIFITVLLLAPAGVIDRIAVIVGNTVITESEVLREVRLTAFLNRQPVDLGPKHRRAAAERLVDQQLIRNEMADGTFLLPQDGEADRMLAELRKRYWPSEARYRAALREYGITEAELRQHLLWELAALRFTDQRFPPLPAAPAESEPSANRVMPGAPMPGSETDRRLDQWLKETRANTRIVFQAGAFQ